MALLSLVQRAAGYAASTVGKAWCFLKQGPIGQVLGPVIGFYAIGLLGCLWLWLAGWDRQAAFVVPWLAPVPLCIVAWIVFSAIDKERGHENMVSARQWRMAALLAVLWVLAPILAHWVGGWFHAHRFWFLLIVPLAFGFVVSVVRFGKKVIPAILRFADHLPPGSSSTRLS